MKNRNLFTFLSGAAIGAGIAWLFTSDEGKKQLEKLKEKFEKLKDGFDLKKVSEIFDNEESSKNN